MTESTGTNLAIAGLPLPPKEKIARWLGHGAILALGVTGVITFMPFINKALTLLLDGMFTFAQLGLMATAVLFGSFAVMTGWPLYKRFIESCANKATWALFEYDPITPMMMWLKEVRRDSQTIEAEYENVQAVIAQNEQVVEDNLHEASSADKKFAQAVRSYGQESAEARLAALEPGTLRETAERIKANTAPLYEIRDILKEVVSVTQFTERKAELDVDAYRKELASAESVERATNSANRVLRARSERKQNAMMAMKIIHDKYAGSFGRLQGLRELSRQAIMSVDLQKGVFHQEALERLKAESRFIIGGRQPELLEAKPVGKEDGVSFYRVPEKVRASRK